MIVGTVNFLECLTYQGRPFTKEEEEFFIKEKLLEVLNVMRHKGAKGRYTVKHSLNRIDIRFSDGTLGCVKISGRK